MPWWQSCGWANTIQKHLEAPLHKEWPCCESRFGLAAVTHFQFSQSHPWAHTRYKSRSPCAGEGGQKPDLHWAQLQAQQKLQDLLGKRGMGLFHILWVRARPLHADGSTDSSLGCSLQTPSKTKISLQTIYIFLSWLLHFSSDHREMGKGRGTRKNIKPIGTVCNKRLQQICHTISLLIKLNGLSRERHKRKHRFKYLWTLEILGDSSNSSFIIIISTKGRDVFFNSHPKLFFKYLC